MNKGRQSRAQKKSVRSLLRSISTFVSWAAPAALIAGAFYFGAYEPARSQIESRKQSAPFSSSVSSSQISKTKIPKAPAQVEMPAPPPTKLMAGLEEQLVATGPVTEEESKDLDAALKAFHEAPLKAAAGSDYTDFSKPFVAFINAHPNSNWNAALYLNLGLGYYRAGYFSKVFPLLEKAWQLGRNATSFQARLMIDRAVGELARMHARLGHKDELEALFKDIGKRPIGGPATELIQNAHEGLADFHTDPSHAYLCGPKALASVLITLKAGDKQIRIADDALSGEHGFSLHDLAKLADKTRLKYKLIHREPGQPVPVPSVVNWNVHHYAALVAQGNGSYIVQDPTFANISGSPLTMKVIDAESSGYFLVPESVIKANPKAGWRVVPKDAPEIKGIYGMGDPIISNDNETTTNSCHKNSSSAPSRQSTPIPGQSPTIPGILPMTICNAHTMVVSLNLTDTPLGYSPQKGLPNYVTLYYNQREALQPPTFNYGNVGPKWTLSVTRFIDDNPINANSYPVTEVPGGGGGFLYPNVISGYTGEYFAEPWTGAINFRSPIGGGVPTFTRKKADGGVEHYTLSDGATTAPRHIYLTSETDPQGNTTTYNYDTSLRLTSIVDAMGRSTTFTYALPGYPLLLTQVTDPFGRTTQLTYDTSGRLATITDPIGITSSFTYSTTEPTFITNLTTPYGTTTFNDTPPPSDPFYTNTRSLTTTDPMGNTDFLYYYRNSTIVPSTDPSAIVPTGMLTNGNGRLEWRNTFYWDKHAFALACTLSGGVVTAHDYTKAFIYHWNHDGVTNSNMTGATPESTKAPLENRVWYNYPLPYLGSSIYTGKVNNVSVAGRVLDSGATQLFKTNYNATSSFPSVPDNLLSTTDPLGRTTKYNYATNNIDLLTVQQLTTSPSTYTTIATYGSYNSQHEPQTYTDAAGQTWNYTYNSAGQIKTVTDPNSSVTTWNYDTSGRLSTIVDANSVTVLTLTYDSADRIRTRTDSQGYVLTYDYDNLDRITQITYPDATTDQYDYNFQSGPNIGTPSLELRKYTDRLGRVTLRDYDANQRLVSVTEPIAGSTTRTTTFDYYEDGTLKNLTDANGNVTHWEVDLESRPTSKTYAYGTASAKTETYTYETSTSRLKSVTDALGQVKTFTYGLDDSISGITYTSTVNPTPNVTFAYDTYFPRMTSMTDGTGTTNYSYNAIGTNGALDLSSIAGPYSNDSIGLTYDVLGRLSGRTITGGNETFGYDAINRLTSHGTPLGTFTYGYLGETSQTTSRSVTNGSTTVSTSWGYDTNTNDRRLISIANSGVTRSFTLSYLNGSTQNPYDIMSITDTAATGHPFATQSHSYSYDDSDRLLTANQTTPGNFAYGYDKLDNATTVTTPSGTVTPAPTYNVNNQLATWASNSYSYDANGNTLSGDGTKTYKWDAENRLIEIDYVGTSNKTVFTYNGMGQRRAVAETVSGSATTTRYLWCGGFICQSRDASDNVLKRYTGEGEYVLASGQKLVYMPDQLGSVRDVLDATTGSRVASYDFSPYGAVTQSSVTNGTDYQYARLFYHQNSGLYLSATRAYDSAAGRWLSRDTIKELGGTNLYGYAGASPLDGIDPNGQFWFLVGCLSNPACVETVIYTTVIISSFFNQSMAEFAEELPLNPLTPEIKACKAFSELRWHHPLPMYLGGPVKQRLVPLAPQMHNAYHSGLDKLLPRRLGGTFYQNAPRSSQELNRQILIDFTNRFDNYYGTDLSDALKRSCHCSK